MFAAAKQGTTDTVAQAPSRRFNANLRLDPQVRHMVDELKRTDPEARAYFEYVRRTQLREHPPLDGEDYEAAQRANATQMANKAVAMGFSPGRSRAPRRKQHVGWPPRARRFATRGAATRARSRPPRTITFAVPPTLPSLVQPELVRHRYGAGWD